MTPPGFVLPDMLPATAEIFLLGMACIVLVVDVYLPERFRRFTCQLSQASLARGRRCSCSRCSPTRG